MNDMAVIMSVYKKDRLIFLKESVQSILEQTFTEFDYFLIFDGPVDPEIESYISSINDNRLRLYKLEKNGGLASALNYLLRIVMQNDGYRIIARMDADDISMPERFEKQFSFLIRNPNISVVGCWYEEIDEEGKHLADVRLPLKHEELRRRYYTRTPFAHSSVMFTRELIEKAGFYPTDTILMEDNALWGRALSNSLLFANLPEVLLKFRIDKNFYRRRSGIKYGLNFIKTHLRYSNSNRSPLSSVFPIFKGLLIMLPSPFIRLFYALNRKIVR
jgi:glycosyltransferase involved in cell wall biosynthesis